MKTIWIVWVVVLVWNCCGAENTASETKKVFPEFKCSFELPGPNWEWSDCSKTPGAICSMVNRSGLALIVAIKASPIETMSPEFITTFDKSVVKDGRGSIRGSRELTFQTVPCHELYVAPTTTSGSMATRFFMAHGFAYTMVVASSNPEAEKDPDYDAVMNSLAFTTPPPPPETQTSSARLKWIELAGQATAYLLIAAFVGVLFWKKM